MKSDLKQVIQRVVTFLDKSITDQQLEDLEKYLHIDSMRENTLVFNMKGTTPEHKKRQKE